MFNNLETSLTEVNEDTLNSVFDSDDSGLGKSENKDKDTSKDKTPSKKTPPVKTKSKNEPSPKEKSDSDTKGKTLSNFSKDDENAAFGNDDEDEDEDKNELPLEDEDDDTEEGTPGEDDEDETIPKEDEEDEPKEEEDEEERINEFLAQRANLLIKNGYWADFDDRDKFEWTEESFAEMELQQQAHQKEQMVEQILDSFGPYGREIAEYTAQGGDADKLIDIFKDQQKIENLSIETEEGQRAVVAKYETEFLGRKPERVKKYIDGLIADKELASEAKEAKEAMDSILDQQAKDLQAEQKQAIQQRKEKQKSEISRFSSDVTKVINDNKDIPEDEKATLLKVLTKFNRTLPNGTPINEFYNKFAEFKKNLPDYVNLVRFVINPSKFIKGIQTQQKNKDVEKTFSLSRKAAKTRKVASANPLESRQEVTTKFKL